MPKTVEKPSVAISGGLTRIFSYIDWTIRFSRTNHDYPVGGATVLGIASTVSPPPTLKKISLVLIFLISINEP